MHVRKDWIILRIWETEINAKFDIILTVHHDKLYIKTNEMHFLEFYSDDILCILYKNQQEAQNSFD